MKEVDTMTEQHPSRQIMCPRHPQWDEFTERLGGPEGCNFQRSVPTDPKSTTWTCTSRHDYQISRRILAAMGFGSEEIEQSLSFFSEQGAGCDCEILFNLVG
jgi:hypothetical protein